MQFLRRGWITGAEAIYSRMLACHLAVLQREAGEARGCLLDHRTENGEMRLTGPGHFLRRLASLPAIRLEAGADRLVGRAPFKLLRAGASRALSLVALAVFLAGSSAARSDEREPANPSQVQAAAVEEAYEWRRVAIGGGGFITGYDSDPTGATRVARADVHGAYIWLPNQDRWAQLVTSANMPESFRVQNGVNEGVYEIVVAPSRPSRIFMAVKGRVFRSDDRGASFIEAVGGLPADLRFHPNSGTRNAGPFLAVSPRDPDLVFLGTPEHGLWRSQDGGSAWARVSSVPMAIAAARDSGEPPSGIMIWFERNGQGATGRIWALSPGHGIFRSDDLGLSFMPLVPAQHPQPRHLAQGAFAPDGTFYGADEAGRRAWKYQNGAWEDLVGRTNLPAAAFVAVAVNPRSEQIFIFDQGGRAYRSSKGGGSWTRLLHRSKPGENDPPWLKVSNQSYFAMGRVSFDPVVPDRLWAGTGTGVYYTDVPSLVPLVTWISQARGIEELVATDVVQGAGAAPLFAALDFGVHRKEDLFSFSTTYGPKERVLIAVQQLALTPSTPGFVATNASDTRTTCCSEDGDAVLAGFSTDGGRQWRKFESLPTPPGTDAKDPWRMSFGTIAVSAGSPDNIVWEPSFGRTPHYTLDRGKTWFPITLAGRSSAPGSHLIRFMQRKTLTADAVNAGVFYLAYPELAGASSDLAGLWRSQDGGKTWQHVFKSEIAPGSGYAAKLRAAPGRAGDLFFTSAVTMEGDLRLRRSRDGGSSWHAIDGVEQVDDIAFGKPAAGSQQPTIFLSGRVDGRYGIWRSVDDGRSWVMVGRHPVGSLDQVTVMGADPDRFGRVYIGYMGSGFVTGESRDCFPVRFHFHDVAECLLVAPAQKRAR